MDGFLLSTTLANDEAPARDGRRSTRLIFQGRLEDGRRFRWKVTRPLPCFFVEGDAPIVTGAVLRKSPQLRSLRGRRVDVVYFDAAQEMAKARRHYESLAVPTFEADVSTAARYLMERGIRGGVRFLDPPTGYEGDLLEFVDPKVDPGAFTPRLRLLSLDVECSLRGELFSISAFGRDPLGGDFSRVFLVDPSRNGEKTEDYQACGSETEVLRAFFGAVREFDPDALIGWNVINFDLRWLAGKCARLRIPFDIGTDGPAELIEPDGGGRNGTAGRFGPQWLARIPGRAALDGIAMLKAAFVDVEGYSLNSVSRELLGKGKLIELEGSEKTSEIERQFREDKPALARYNLLDSVLALEIFEKLSLAQLAVRKAQLMGLAVDRMGGSVAAFDFLYLPELHRRGFVADTGSGAPLDETVPGGLVLDGQPGFHRHVLVLDFKSLYPSIIRTFQVDPLAAALAQTGIPVEGPRTLVRGPAGPAFMREQAILPGIVASLSEARETAKRAADASLSQAVKILMNSLYGVLGTPNCRFYHPDLAGTITRIGQWVLLKSRDFLEAGGHRVIYGDTDSLFVAAGTGDGAGDTQAARRLGAKLCLELNGYLQQVVAGEFGVESHLTIQFEKLFLRFFLPALRKEERSSKKRYAGLLAGNPEADPALHFTGLESARSDWTPLAKDFQAALLTAAFALESWDDRDPLEKLVRDWNRRLFQGELDDRLEYRKGLSKDPDQYAANAPPHVRAARALDQLDGRIIRYVMTVEGPEPMQKRSGAKPDYRHYADKQLAPIADMVLRFLGTDFQSMTTDSQQLSIF